MTAESANAFPVLRLVFVLLSGGFAWFLVQGLRNGEVAGKDWLRRKRIYSRAEQPIAYFTLLFAYTVGLLLCLGVAIFADLGG